MAGEESGILSWAEGGKKDSQPAGSEVEIRVKCAGFRSICAGFLSRNRSNAQVFEANTQVFVKKSAKIDRN